MRRGYASLQGPDDGWQIHYREAGHGSPLLLLHPSPLSSAALLPQLQILAPLARCIAWDTPGYGASDPLPQSWQQDSLTPYVAAVSGFLDALGLDQALIYGSATGAQIAIEFSKTHPERCSGLLLENVALFSEEECAQIVDGYFPDLTPRADGGHLADLWNMARRSTRYFPWNADDGEATRRSGYPDPAIINGAVRDYLSAGTDYARAYRAAFNNERLEGLQAVQTPTRILLWDDGMLGKYSERLASAELPASMEIRRAGAGMEARLDMLGEAAAELLGR